MLSSYSVTCPHAGCDWSGSIIPSRLQDGTGAEIASGSKAWFQCPSCSTSWEVRITNDRVTVVPVAEHGSGGVGAG
jgi:hypothetical protein